MQQTWKTAWTCVPFTSIMFIHFYLVDFRHFQNYIELHISWLFFEAPFGLAS